MKRLHLWLLGPTLLGIVLVALPLILGERTLFWRDVSDLHLGLKVAQARAMANGELPLVDMVRTTGEPLLGNANGLPLYPTNLLYLCSDFFWAFNAHFWLHWLATLAAFYALARSFELSPAGAAAAATFWATSGYFLSQLNFYNLTAVAALAPALIASSLAAADRPRHWPLFGLIFSLMLLAGDPFSTLLTLAGAALAWWLRPRPFPWLAAPAALLGGLLLSAPMLVELKRILPSSLRAFTNNLPAFSLLKSYEPLDLVELFLPFFRGTLQDGYRGDHPLFYALFPGVLVIAAALAARGGGHLRWQARWAIAMIGLGFFFSFGSYNPVVSWLYSWLPGMSLLRFPVKYSLWWALGSCLLAGIGIARFWEEPASRIRLGRILAGLTVAYLLLLVTLPWLSFAGWGQPLGFSLPAQFVAEKVRWFETGMVLTLAAGLLWLATKLERRSVLLATASLLALGSAFQLYLLQQLYLSDAVDVYRQPAPALARIPPDSLVFNLSFRNLADKPPLPPDLEVPSVAATQVRCAAAELAPAFGTWWGRRFILVQSADFLDSYNSYFLFFKISSAPATQALAVLRALGVDRVVASREIGAEAAGQVELLGSYPNECRRETFVYALRDAAPGEYLMLGNLRRFPDPDQLLAFLAAGRADFRTTAVLSGIGDPLDRPNGTVRELERSSDGFLVEVDSPQGGTLIARRNALPFYRAEIDGQNARLEVANLLHLALELPPGRHRVKVEADRRPTHLAFLVAGLAALGLIYAAWRLPARSQAKPPAEAES